jgi:uncharacterized protein YfaS (alpha-2-macroglobulin family)
MDWKKIKWMVIGSIITISITLGIHYFDSFKKLSFGTQNKLEFKKIDPDFAQYISAFTTGYISTGSTIKIRFTSQILETVELNTPIKEELFDFNNNIEGEARWIDAQTIEFKPKDRLPEGEKYDAVFYLGKLLDVNDKLKEFSFQFKTIEQSVQIEFNDLRTYSEDDYSYYKSSGTIYTADFIESQKLEKILTSKSGITSSKINWIHDEKGTTHRFYIDSIARSDNSARNLIYNWDFNFIKQKTSGEKNFTIPSKETFTLLNVQVINSPEQFVQIALSNPINKEQSLEGLINLAEFKDLKIVTDNNLIKLYPNETKTGTFKLTTSEHIRDGNGKSLDKDYEHEITFEEVKPKIKFTGNGVILPSTNGLTLPFEAVNLKAVDIKILKIYENNMLQFLQNNELNGDNELARVGKKIVEKTINLGITNPADFKRFKKFSVDLNSLIKTEPGAIYRVTLGFKKSYSTYSCNGVSNTDNIELEEIKTLNSDEDFGYYYYSDYYYEENYDEDSDYNWEQRDNPCNSAYYSSYNTSISKNLLASDIGLTVKKGNNGSLFFAASNLVDTKPIAGLEIELYDYQQQLIQTAKTNGDGHLFVTPSQKPYFVIGKKDKQRCYIKLDDGNSLSLSMFDTEGESVQKGLKGFIYGERGVWRPGDTLFLHFILEDKLKALPSNHPVVFELRNPQGMVYKKMLKSKGMDAFYAFTVPTENHIPTGNWQASCKVGAVQFNKNIRIETIMPNRLKINVDVADNKLIDGNSKNLVRLHANWLTGAKAKNLKATLGVALSSTQTEFKNYKNYTFNDPTQIFNSDNITLFDGKLNEEGDASFNLNIEAKENAGGMLKANFATRVYEPGGAFSVDRFSALYSPFNTYIGISLPEGEKNSGILYTEQEHTINIASVNYKGEGVSCSRIKVEVYKLDWRWWWDQYDDELANYNSSEYHVAYLTKEISTKAGRGSFKLKMKNDEWGRYLIKVKDLDGGHSCATTAYIDWSNWMERGGNDNKIVAGILQFTSDKESYKTSEEASISIPSPQGGRALVTIETGSKVLEAHWLETQKGTTRFKFKITPEMAPNVYVHVSLMQPHAQTVNDLPIRLYGVIPVIVDDPETHLRPTITMPSVLAPETKTSITVGEENGKEMTYTVAIVDEGLLDLTRYKTPEPWNHFYAREALGIKTWDVYDNVIGAYGGELERILSIGGDGGEINKDGAKTNRFKPMVKVIGPFHIGKGEKKTHTFKMPMYIGSVRTMVIAGYKGAYGNAEKTTPVKSPIMILGTLPRVLSVGEEVNLPVSVFGGDVNLSNVNVSVSSNELVQIVGKNSQITNLSKNDEKLLTFKLKVLNKTGVAKVNIVASAGNKKTFYSMELDVRNPNPFRTNIKELVLEPGKQTTLNYSAIGAIGTNSGSIELSTIPAVNLESRLDYLVSYPHGCLEQTTSAAFAQLYLDDMMPLSAIRKSELERNIKAAIQKLQDFQQSNGSFAYWPGQHDYNDWANTYALHFLISAEKKGYTVNSGMKQNCLKFIEETSNSWSFDNRNKFNDFTQAYKLYVLSVAGKPQMAAMNRLREETNLSMQAKWRLAAAYAITGNTDEAEKIIAKTSSNVERYAIDYYTYGSEYRDEAMILETLCLLDKKSSSFAVLKKLASALSGKEYLSTHTTAYSLLAVSKYIKKFGSASAMQVEVDINGKKEETNGNHTISSIPVAFNKNPKGTINISNKGKGLVYIRLINKGKPAISEEKEEEENLITEVKFKSEKGEIINPDHLNQGTNFTMEITVKNPGTMGHIKNLAILNYIPSGWEIHNARMDDNEASLKNSGFDYQDIRDDRIMTYLDIKPNETKIFRFNLNASYKGRYYMPGVNTEAMYDNSVYSRKKGHWIYVK